MVRSHQRVNGVKFIIVIIRSNIYIYIYTYIYICTYWTQYCKKHEPNMGEIHMKYTITHPHGCLLYLGHVDPHYKKVRTFWPWFDTHQHLPWHMLALWLCRLVYYKSPPHLPRLHYDDVIMGATASQITSLAIVYSSVYWGTDQRKHHRSASLAFVREIHRGPVNSLQKWPVTRKIFPFDDVIMCKLNEN